MRMLGELLDDTWGHDGVDEEGDLEGGVDGAEVEGEVEERAEVAP